jgi:hypothetical protein
MPIAPEDLAWVKADDPIKILDPDIACGMREAKKPTNWQEYAVSVTYL